MRPLWLAATLVVALAGALRGAQAQTAEADVALVLAVDVSGSVDDRRFKLQREGIAAALESDDFAAVLSGGGNQTIEIAVVEWAEDQSVVVPWTIIRGREDLLAVTDRLRHAARSGEHVKTVPNAATAPPDRLFAPKRLPAIRQGIHVSGARRQNIDDIAPTPSSA